MEMCKRQEGRRGPWAYFLAILSANPERAPGAFIALFLSNHRNPSRNYIEAAYCRINDDERSFCIQYTSTSI